jgi:Protein of unknown function (DUF4239)
MLDWLQNLPVVWMTVVVFLATYLMTGVIYWVVATLAVGERARAFKAISPGMLPPLGIIFGLLVAFVAAQVWTDLGAAGTAVTHEASALRGVALLAGSFPGKSARQLRALVRRHVDTAVTQEWPKMARQEATLTVTSAPLAKALRLILALKPQDEGQAAAQGEIIALIGDALEARRERIIISGSAVNWVKWSGLLLQAICTLVAIAMVHSDNRITSGIAMTLFATGIAVSVVLIAAHNRPFSGEISVTPDVLLQILPQEREGPAG